MCEAFREQMTGFSSVGAYARPAASISPSMARGLTFVPQRAAAPRAARGRRSRSSVWSIVKRRARLAGLEGNYGAHSLRSGFVTEAGRQEVPMKEAMAMTGHRSLAAFLRYFQSGQVQVSRAANLLGDLPRSNDKVT
jgi:hypothetical protein